YGQGWMGAGMPADQLAKAVGRLREIAEANGRDPNAIDIAPQFTACIDTTYEGARARFRNSQMYNHLVSLSGTTLKDQVAAGADFEDIDLLGTADNIVETIEQLREAGAT